MRLHILSDLHLEFGIEFRPPEVDADVVVLAGDIHSHTRGIAWAAETFRDRRVLYVLGNHEPYGAELFGLTREARKAAREAGVWLIERDAVVIEDVRFLGATLWTGFLLFGRGANQVYAMREAER